MGRSKVGRRSQWLPSLVSPRTFRSAPGWSSGQLAKVYGFTDLYGSRPDAWPYVVEVQEAGKPADATGCR